MRSRSEAWVSARPPRRPSPSTISSLSGTCRAPAGELRLGRPDSATIVAFRQVAVTLCEVIGSRCAAEQLDAEREPPLANHPAHAIERNVERLALGAPANARTWSARRAAARSSIRRSARRAVSGRRPNCSASGAAWARINASSSRQLRPRIQQAIKVHSARQSVDDVAEAIEGAVRIGAGRDRPHQGRQHHFECLPRGRRTQGPCPARPPLDDSGDRLRRSREAHRSQFGTQDVGIVGQPLAPVRRQPVEVLPDALDVGSEQSEEVAPRSASAMQPRDSSSACGSAGRRCFCGRRSSGRDARSVRSSAIGVGKLAARSRFQPSRCAQRIQRVQRRRRAQLRVATAMNQLLDLGEEFGLANPAAAALQVEARAECLALREMITDAREISRISSIAPKSSARRQMNGRISSRNCPPSSMSPAAARARMNAARSHGRAPAFIMGDGRIDREDDRRHFGRRPKPQVDARDIAVRSPLLQQFDQAAADPDRRFARRRRARAAAAFPDRTTRAGRRRTNN